MSRRPSIPITNENPFSRSRGPESPPSGAQSVMNGAVRSGFDSSGDGRMHFGHPTNERPLIFWYRMDPLEYFRAVAREPRKRFRLFPFHLPYQEPATTLFRLQGFPTARESPAVGGESARLAALRGSTSWLLSSGRHSGAISFPESDGQTLPPLNARTPKNRYKRQSASGMLRGRGARPAPLTRGRLSLFGEDATERRQDRTGQHALIWLSEVGGGF